MLRTNLTSALYTTRAVLPGMYKRRAGRIINISSAAGQKGFVGAAAYAASKGGLDALTRVVAVEAARYGVTCNVISPGMLDGGMGTALSPKIREAYPFSHSPRPHGRSGGRRRAGGLSGLARRRLHHGSDHRCQWRHPHVRRLRRMPTIPTHKGCQFYEVWGPEGAPSSCCCRGAFSRSWQYLLLRDHLATDLRVITVDYRGDGQSKNRALGRAPGSDRRGHVCARGAPGRRAMPRHRDIHGRVRAGGDDAPRLSRRRALDHRERTGVARKLEAADDASRAAPPNLLIWKLAPTQQIALASVGDVRLRALPEGATRAFQGDGGPHPACVGAGAVAGLQQFAGMFGYEWGRHRVLERLERKTRLLMTGDQDILAPIENVREHPLFLEGPTLVFRQAGHRFFYEDAQPFNDIAHHFLSQGQLPEPLPGHGIVQPLERSA